MRLRAVAPKHYAIDGRRCPATLIQMMATSTRMQSVRWRRGKLVDARALWVTLQTSVETVEAERTSNL
jgi:hypothetical protein